MRVSALVAMVWCSIVVPHVAVAQNDQTLADIRQELNVLYVDVQRLKRELSTSAAPNLDTSGGSTLDRINAIEAELQRLTAKTEQLEFRVDRVVSDGTNRIGDLEFRLVELEGGDISTLGETTTLGGGELPQSSATLPAAKPAAPATELAMSEQADFDKASEALAAGQYQAAADQFATFSQTYPGGPLAAEAALNRGKALEGTGNIRDAARAYLDSFSGDPTGPLAPESLLKLGTSLAGLNQTSEACVTLSEVAVRFPGAPAVTEAEAQKRNLGCP
ncbi:MAG: tol-pal system protein YbgF [Paracoccaceae bacterium]